MNSNVKKEIPSGSTSRSSGGSQLVPRIQFVAAAADETPKSKYLKSARTARSMATNAARSDRRRSTVRPSVRPKA